MANLVFLDTETTGLDDTAEVIEIAIVDAAGAVIFVCNLHGHTDTRDKSQARSKV